MILYSFWLLAATSAALQADAETDAFFAEFATKREQIRTVEARFSQKTVTPDETLDSAGTITYVRPKRLVFRYAGLDLAYLIDGRAVFEYDGELEQLQIYELEDRPDNEALFLGFEDDPARLTKAYRVSIVRPREEGSGRRAIELRPKNDEAYFSRVTIEFRASDFLPEEIVIENTDDSTVMFTLDRIRVNAPLTGAPAQIHVPEGTSIIDGDRFVETVGPGGKTVPRNAAPPESAAP